MGNAYPANWPSILDQLELNGPASVAISIGDLLYFDYANTLLKPLTSLTTGASEALDQAAIARQFAGMANSARLSTDAAAGPVRFIADRVYDMPCVSGTFKAGDLVGATWDGGAALVNQKVAKVSTLNLAIGVVVKNYTSNTTKVKIRLLGRTCIDLMNRPGNGIGGQQGNASTLMADADTTLTVASNPIQKQVPTAARNITLPAEAQSAGLEFYFVNNSAGAFNMVIKDAAANTIATVAQNKRGHVVCDGTNWFGGPFA